MSLSPQQQDIIDALRCMEWCEIPDLLAASTTPNERALRRIVSQLRCKGYRIWCKRGWKSRGRVGAYSLRGEP